MNVGDLVQKVKGYGSEMNWTGLVVEIKTNNDGSPAKVRVLTEDGIENWHFKTVEVINESSSI